MSAVTTCFLISTSTLLLCSVISGQSIDGSLLRDTVNKVANEELGANLFQEYLASSVTFSTAQVNGKTVIRNIAEQFKVKMDQLKAGVRTIQISLESVYSRFSNSQQYGKCCSLAQSNLQYNAGFRSNVNTDMLCQLGDGEEGLRSVYATAEVLAQFKNIEQQIDNINVKWQYFATNTGILFNYPAVIPSNCSSFDPRTRPWFIASAVTLSKDVIIVVDNSEGMASSRLNSISASEAAKRAARGILQTLQPQDRVAVVAFSDVAQATDICQSEILQYAVPHVKTELADFLEFLVVVGKVSNYSAGIEKALNLLFSCKTGPSSCTEDDTREKVIVFLSGVESASNSADHANVFRIYDSRITTAIQMYSFGIGAVTSGAVVKLKNLTSIANEQGNALTKGNYVHLFSELVTTKEVNKFYHNFVKITNAGLQPLVSYPYQDSLGLGTVVSITAPVIAQNQFVGVLGIDVTVTDLLSNTVNLQAGAKSYAFVLNHEKDYVLNHPLLPSPFNRNSTTQEELVVSLDTVEGSMSKAILLSLQSGQEGQVSVRRNYTYTYGNTFREGVLVKFQNADVYYRPIPSTSFSAIFVNFNDAARTATVKNGAASLNFLYHIIYPQGQTLQECKVFFHKTYKNPSVVKFSPKAFLQPEVYLGASEDLAHVQRYTSIMNDPQKNDLFKAGITTDVRITSILNDEWTTKSLNPTNVPSAVWRYIGTERGIFRVYPPSTINKEFDHTTRPWYKRAAHNVSQVGVSYPYLDEFGTGYVATISKAVTEPGTIKIYGVMGMDIKITTLYEMVIRTYPVCALSGFDCFLIDSAGYLVMHSNWVFLTYKAEPTVENVHITQWEPEIADHMHLSGYLERRTCQNIADRREQYYSRVNIPRSGVNELETENAWYKIDQIFDTNLFIVLRSTGNTFNVFPMCTCDFDLHQILTPRCELSSVELCECPCYLEAPLNFCEERRADPAWLPCPPVQISSIAQDHQQPTKDKVKNLPLCHDPACAEISNQRDCHRQAQCHWCPYNTDGVALRSPFCAYWEDCILGQRNHRSLYEADYGFSYVAPPNVEQKADKGAGGGVIAAIVIAVIVVILIPVFVGLYFLHVKRREEHPPSPTNMTELLVDLTSQRAKKGEEHRATVTLGPGGVPYLVIDNVDEHVLESHKGLDAPRGSILLPRGSLEGEDESHGSHQSVTKKGHHHHHHHGAMMIPLSGVDTAALAGRGSKHTQGSSVREDRNRRASTTIDDYIVGGHHPPHGADRNASSRPADVPAPSEVRPDAAEEHHHHHSGKRHKHKEEHQGAEHQADEETSLPSIKSEAHSESKSTPAAE